MLTPRNLPSVGANDIFCMWSQLFSQSQMSVFTDQIKDFSDQMLCILLEVITEFGSWFPASAQTILKTWTQKFDLWLFLLADNLHLYFRHTMKANYSWKNCEEQQLRNTKIKIYLSTVFVRVWKCTFSKSTLKNPKSDF